MGTNKYENFDYLEEEYYKFLKEIADLPNEESIAKGRELLLRLQESGKYIDRPQERDIISAWCRDIGDKIYEITDEYPAVRIAPLNRGGLRSVPELPPNFLPRPDDLVAVREALLADDSPSTAITGIQSKVGLYGMGGIGKSVLAAAVARDEAIRSHFRDGIFWLTIGIDPNIPRRQSDLAGLLDNKSFAFEDAEQGRIYLSRSLANKACLIILDDIWHADDAKELVGDIGPECRILITTRDAGIIKALGAREYRLDLLSHEKSMKLLAGWANKEVAALPPEASQIVRECGNLPLALALAGAQVNDGVPWKDLLEALKEASLQFLDHPQGSVMKSIKISVDNLTDEEKECYLKLAVFPPDEPVPAAAILTLWTYDNKLIARDARLIISVLGRKALLKIKNPEFVESSTIELHDLQHDYLKAVCKDLKSLHNLLLNAYGQKTSNSSWSTGPNDGYFFQHLAYHLLEAGLTEDAILLLHDFEWIRKKLSLFDDINVLLNDYELAQLKEDSDINLVRKAIRFSSNVLKMDPNQLPSQLFGRLVGIESQRIKKLLDQAKETTSYPWLRPLTPCLISFSRGISSVAVTPDNRRALLGSSYRSIGVWDLETGKEIGILEGHTKGISSVTVSSDGLRAVSGSADHTVKVWDLENYKELQTLKGNTDNTDTVFSVAVSHDRKRAISGSNDGTIKVWDLETGREISTLKGHSDSIYSVAIFPDGRRAVSGSDDRTIKVWDLENGKEIKTLRGHTDWISGVAISPDCRKVVSGSWDKTIKIWDLETGKEDRTLKGHKHEVSSIAISPDGQRVVSGSWDKTIKIWDLKTGKEDRTLKGHNRPVGAVAVSPDGQRVVSGSWDHITKIWDLVSGKELFTLKGNIITIGISALAVSPDARGVVSGSSDGIITIWKADGRERKSFKAHKGLIYSIALTEDGRIVSGSSDKTIKVWDLETGKEIRTIGNAEGANTVFIAPGGQKAVSGSSDGTINVSDLETSEDIGTFENAEGISKVFVAPDFQRVVSLLDDKTIKVWDLETGIEKRTLKGPSKVVNAFAVTPNSRKAILGSSEGAITILDLESGRKNRTQKIHNGLVSAIAIFRDNRTGISASDDGTIRIWDLETMKNLATFYGGSMTAVAIAEDEINVIAGDNEGRVHSLVLENLSRSD